MFSILDFIRYVNKDRDVNKDNKLGWFILLKFQYAKSIYLKNNKAKKYR